jgi:hypothetical protein
MLQQRPTQPSKVMLVLSNYLFAHSNECSAHSSDASMADARKAPPASHFRSNHLGYASQSVSKEPVWAHGRVRHTVLLAVLARIF